MSIYKNSFRFLLLAIFLILFQLSGTANAQEKQTIVAVLDFNATETADKTYTESFVQRFTIELVASNKYRVVDRKSVDELLKEQEFQMSGCTESECAVEIGRLLSVQKVVVGNIVRSGNTYYVVVQLISVETGLIEQTSDVRCECAQDLGAFLDSAVILAHKFTGNSKIFEKKPERSLSKMDLELKKAKRLRLYGRVLTIGGLIIGTTGVIRIIQHDCEYKDVPNPDYDGNPDKSWNATISEEVCSGPDPMTSIGMIIFGSASFAGGLPTWIVGSNKVKKLEKQKGRITSYYITPVLSEDEYGLTFTLRY